MVLDAIQNWRKPYVKPPNNESNPSMAIAEVEISLRGVAAGLNDAGAEAGGELRLADRKADIIGTAIDALLP